MGNEFEIVSVISDNFVCNFGYSLITICICEWIMWALHMQKGFEDFFIDKKGLKDTVKFFFLLLEDVYVESVVLHGVGMTITLGQDQN